MDSKLFFVCLIALFPAVLATYYPYNCTDFCTGLETICSGANQQFPADSAVASATTFCETACAVTNTTNSTTWNDDTYDCRYNNYLSAKTDANTYCINAGPLGGDQCGKPEQAYCDLVLSACSATANTVYAAAALPARQLCLAVGSSFSISTTTDLAIPNAEPTGITINCHEYHGLVAAQSPTDATIHCPHAGPFGAGVCGTPAENFCAVVQNSCPDNFAGYPSYAYCVAVASTFPAATGSAVGSEVSGNTLGCRFYHAAVAHYIPDPHCFHTAAGGGDGVCGTACDAYCSIFQSACGSSPYAYADVPTCLTACSKFNNSAPYYRLNNTDQPAPSGDTLDCRLYHATAAAAVNATIHCPHASQAGGGVCFNAILGGSSSGGSSGGFSSPASSSTGPSSNSASSLKVAFGAISFVVAAAVFLLDL